MGTLFYWRVEGWSVLDSFYFCVLTFATVGGGDLAPATLVGKIFTTLVAIVCIGILLGFIYVVVKSTINDRSGRDIL
jgi:voltage-gated potassium channel